MAKENALCLGDFPMETIELSRKLVHFQLAGLSLVMFQVSQPMWGVQNLVCWEGGVSSQTPKIISSQSSFVSLSMIIYSWCVEICRNIESSWCSEDLHFLQTCSYLRKCSKQNILFTRTLNQPPTVSAWLCFGYFNIISAAGCSPTHRDAM